MSATPTTDGEEVRPALEALVEHVARTHHVPDLVWGVVLDGRLEITGAASGSDDPGRLRPSSRTVFRIASMTKSFTAATVLRLRDDGVLALDDPLPEVPTLPTADSPPITLRHLLSMQSGLTSDDPWADRHLDITPADLDDVLAGARFACPPGTAFEYSNLGYGAIGRAVERITGRRLQDLADELVLAPLGLRRTTWVRPADDDWAGPHRVEDDRAVADAVPLGDGALAPMGGLWSTVDDLATVVSWFDDAFPPRDDTDVGPLRRSSRRQQQQVQRANAVSRTGATGEGLDHVPERIDGGGYGFGMQVIHDQRFGHIAGHSGGLPGYGSNMRWLPGRRVGVIALANTTYAPMRLLTRRMLELLDDHGIVPPAPAVASAALQEVAERLVALLGGWRDEDADRLFADNVGPDESYARRAAAARELVDAHGVLHLQRVEASLATDATAVATTADGRTVRVWFALAPTAEARVQDYSIELTD